MLSRGVLGRLAADVPRSTHDIAHVAAASQRLLHPSRALLPSQSHVFRSNTSGSLVALPLRGYATAQKSTRAVGQKKPASKSTTKKAPSRARTAKTSTTATAERPKKDATRAKKPAKKAAPKKREQTEKSKATAQLKKDRQEVRELKEKALLTEPKKLPDTAWLVLNTELTPKGTTGKFGDVTKENAQKYKDLTPSEREHYNHIANENKAANKAAYKAWVESHTPDQIRIANNARTNLKRKLTKNSKTENVKKGTKKFSQIVDDRLVKRPQSAYNLFYKERATSGDMGGIKVPEMARLIADEFKALSVGEKKPYEQQATSAREQYVHEYSRVYGHMPPALNGRNGTQQSATA